MRRAALAGVALLVVLGGVFGAFTSGSGTPDDVPAPAGVAASVQYFRSDQIPHRVQIAVTNGPQGRLKVDEARLVSGRYTGQPAWKRTNAADTAVFAPGQTFDLPASLTAPSCPVKDVPPPQVRLLVEQADGDPVWMRVQATDPDDALPRVQRIDCLRAATLAIADVDIRPLQPLGEGLPGTVEIRLTPTGRPGTLTIASIGGTTLLAPARGTLWRLDRTVSADTGPVTLQLPVKPNRCDPHALADDKVGSMLQFMVTVDGGPVGPMVIPPDQVLKNSVYRFVDVTCGRG